ncbi:MAG: carboxynorspermidine decarboxylase [Candidatus Omnitrophica bacterium]|nr:carboxynorspermidine decarboxylase [Candidatus Omnitrophota bacterium]MBU1128316.1 carboxynorspermidine decarboxylase [Candidatus Omnitrophota bacterium]MBU1657279.1 carboxynorspermidine decarboxylase [Candidatus Omnitrophota bacterium]MBU1784152.1 carboxynorspermidine decarboxylase [Candidatus Omnitrophota bacterium]MBU1851263.1 carboxynorspermidine decarboxylase [Candidatus Omnitrophota bacterium]
MNIISKVPVTPCYVVDENLLIKNLEILADVERRAGCKIILALKAFAMFSTFPLIRQYLSGIAASSLDEARLGSREFGGSVHICAPAYKEQEIDELISHATHINFNSFSQWKRFKQNIMSAGNEVRAGLRVNPEHSEVAVALYDPCAPGSRLGIKADHFAGEDLSGITGLHFHTLCELNSDSLERTLAVVEKKFGTILAQMEWVNFGGGHHITRSDYDTDRLCRLISGFRKKYDVKVYLEPGEAVVLDTGFLVASVLDVIQDDKADIAILDTSAAAHMPDVLEMPYRPMVLGAGLPGEYEHTYRLGGLTCLAGDVIGDYSFPEPQAAGSRIVFKDMAHYTMVKNNTFNGVSLPDIAILTKGNGEFRVVREFGYKDYRDRLS